MFRHMYNCIHFVIAWEIKDKPKSNSWSSQSPFTISFILAIFHKGPLFQILIKMHAHNLSIFWGSKKKKTPFHLKISDKEEL